MTVTEFSRDWVPVLQFVVAVIGLISIMLVWYQVKQTSQWNRLNSQYNFLNNAFGRELDKDLYDAGSKLGIDLKGRLEPLSVDEVDRLLADNDAYSAIVAYLNEYENICAAVRAGIADPEVAYGIHSSRVIKDFMAYSPIINRFRARDQDDEVWIEFENVCGEWRKKAESIRLAKLKKREDLRRSEGIRPRS